MTNQPNPHSREQLREKFVDAIDGRRFDKGFPTLLYKDIEWIVDNCLLDLFDTYTAQQSLLRAREELEKLHQDLELVPFDPTGTLGDEHMMLRTKEQVQWAKDKNRAVSIAAMNLQAHIENRLKQIDKEIKASRLDAEGGEK